VVIGGGVVGAFTSYYLARRGLKVALLEKGHIAGEQSSRNWGWCRKMRRDPRELPLIIEALRLWEGMNELTGAETGFRKVGIAYLCESEAALAGYEAWLEHARLYQLDSRIIGAEEAARLMPGAAKRWAGALYTASDGKATDGHAAYGHAAAARRLGEDGVRALATWPVARAVEYEGLRALLVHGAPDDPLEGYVYPDADLSDWDALPYDAVFMGHTHRPFARRVGTVLVANVGSVGLPRDAGGLASFAVLDTATGDCEHVRVPFAADEVVRRAGPGLHPATAAALLRRPHVAVVGTVLA